MLNLRERTILYSGLAIIAGALLFNLFFAPLLKRNALLDKKIALALAKARNKLQLVGDKGEFVERYRALFGKALPDNSLGEGAVAALAQLEALAKEAGVRIVEIRPQRTQRYPQYQEFPVEVRLEGTMDKYVSFIYAVGNAPSLLRIKRFLISAQPSSQLLSATFLVAYLVPAE